MVDKLKVSLLRQQLEAQLNERGDAWRINNFRLLGLPDILPDEVFSSWVWRVLASGRITKEQLAKVWKIKHPIFWVDGNETLLNFERIHKTLNTIQKELLQTAVWPFKANLAHPETLCLTAEILGRRPIYRYCPDCFAEDTVPYIRKKWRLAFTYVCASHNRLMAESCSMCHQYLMMDGTGTYKYSDKTELSIRYCQACGYDLSKAMSLSGDIRIIEPLLRVQTMLESHTVDQVSYIDPMQQSFVFQQKGVLRYGESTAGFHLNELSKLLMRFNFYDGNVVQSVYAGLCGPMMFGEDSDRIGSFFSKHQLFRNTFWFSENTIYHAYGLNILKQAQKWVKGL